MRRIGGRRIGAAGCLQDDLTAALQVSLTD
ncbi:hypothetical protein FHY35_001139 [Xanthomonas arboricola]|nr:hypothetical protein [Xanthomonas arboricola]NIJ84184.1 hypothetical protein [Xanthomonas arboricola]NIK50554.1 hypothetical protein [Xanthomonas arboricola]